MEKSKLSPYIDDKHRYPRACQHCSIAALHDATSQPQLQADPLPILVERSHCCSSSPYAAAGACDSVNVRCKGFEACILRVSAGAMLVHSKRITVCDLGKMRTKVPCYLKLFNSRYGKIVPGQYISVYCYAAGEVRPSTTARRNLRSCPASSWQQDGNVGSIMRNASPHGCQLAKLACRPHKHVEGMEVAPSNCLTRPSITASRHCVAPAKDNVQTGQRCGARLKSGSSHNGSRPPQAGKKKPPGKSCTLINSKVALPAIGLQCNRLGSPECAWPQTSPAWDF